MSVPRHPAAVLLTAVILTIAAPAAAGAADMREPSRAARSVTSWFPELARAPQTPGMPDGLAVDQYVGTDIARVRDGRGNRSVLLSSLPLRSRVGDSRLRPLSLDLIGGAPGELRPENPVAHVRIATDPAEGFTIGPSAGRLVTIVPVGLRADAPAGSVFAGQVLFAGAREASDLLIRPSATGVQTFEQLTGPDAPETFYYRLELKPGQAAQLDDGVVTIRQDGEVIVRSRPPVAVDADRRQVPVSISLHDDVVRLDVAHRGDGHSYPIAVDPDWTSSYDYTERPGLGLQGWHADVGPDAPSGQPPWYDAFINNVWDPVADPDRKALGFFIRPHVTGASRVFPIGAGARLFFNAPGTTSIRSVTYDNVSRFNARDRQTLRLGLYGQTFGEADDVFEAEILSEDPVTLPRDPFPEDQDTPATSAVMWMFTSPCVPGTDLNCPPSIPSSSISLLKVGSVQLVLTDFDFPTTQAPGTLRDLQDRWTNTTGSRELNPSAIDEGSGVRDLSASVQDSDGTHPLPSIQSPCRPDHDQTNPPQDNAICPRELTLDAPLSVDTSRLLDGRSTFTIDASDLADNTASAGGTATVFSVYLDRNKPVTSVSGELFDGAGAWLRPRHPSTLTVTGTDVVGGQGNTSGIAHNHLTAVDEDGAVVYDRDADTCTPPGPIATPCDPGKASTFSVDPRTFPEGTITFEATSADLATNVSDPVTWTVRIDRTPPAARATGDLLALTSQTTNTTTPTSVTLHGRDAASGVGRLQLIASNSNGETILADRDTCTTDDIDPADESCPHNPTFTVTIDPGDLPDGPTTFIARAIDHAGIRSVDNQDWDTYVDHTPPDPPDSVNIIQTSNTSIQITWPTVTDRPLGSGDVSYEYLIVAGGQPIGTWQPTNNPYAQARGLPPGVTIGVLVRAIDAAQNHSSPTQGLITLRGVKPPVEVEKCRFRLAIGSGPDNPSEPRRPVNTAVEANFRLLRCDSDVQLVTGNICVEAANTANPSDANSQITSWFRIECHRFVLPRPAASNPSATQYQEILCLAGTQSYRAAYRDVTYKIKGGTITIAPGAGAAGERVLKHNCNEAGTWRFLAYQRTNSPSRRLASALGREGLPEDSQGRIPGWEAHHVIATKDNPDSASRGYACFADDDAPNQPLNGVWLRGRTQRAAGEGVPPLLRSSDNYKRLEAFDDAHGTHWHGRHYHGSLRRPPYYAEVNRRLNAATSAARNWVCNKGLADDILTNIRRELIRGSFPS